MDLPVGQRSAHAAKEINALITTSNLQVEQGVQLVGDTGKALQTIVGEVQEINRHVTAIVDSAQEQATGLQQINTAVNQMDQDTQKNAAMVEETTAATHSLACEVASLNQLLGQFKLADRNKTVPAAVNREIANSEKTSSSPARAWTQNCRRLFGQHGGQHRKRRLEQVLDDLDAASVPNNKIPSLPRDLFAATPAEVVVIDTSNYYPQQRDGFLDGIEDGRTESEWVEQHLGRPGIKAFNTIYATHLQPGAKPAGSAYRIALAVAGDDPRTKSKAMALIDEIGFDAVDAGTIAESWRRQPGSPGYLQDFDIKGVRSSLAEAKPGLQPEWRAKPNSPGTYDSPA